MLVSGKVVAQRPPIRPGILAVPWDIDEWTFAFRSAVSGKLRSRGKGRSSLAISNAIYLHLNAVVVVVFGRHVSDELYALEVR